MAAYLSALRSGFLACALALVLPAQALERLVDPTRPGSGIASANQVPAQADGELALQSVLISPQRRLAVVSGHTVRVGEEVAGAKVVRITESEVVLRDRGELRVLRMYPELETKRAVGGRTRNNQQ